MAFETLYKGGKQDWVDAGGMELPLFLFFVTDIEAIKRLLGGMYVELDVRFNTGGKLAYHLEVPDRKMTPWAIELDPAQIPRVEEAAKMLNICMTMIAQQGADAIKLTDSFEDLTHDWSGAYARGHKAFVGGDVAGAEKALAPLAAENPDTIPAAHHILGRCHRARNDFSGAIEHYTRAARAATHTKGHFLPRASGILSDMGVAYKKLSQDAKAAHCLAHSLRQRPNHPAALGTYFTLFGAWEEGFSYCLTRIAAIGSDDELLKALAQAAGGALERDPGALLREAAAEGQRVDVARSPMGSADPIHADSFFEALASISGDAARPTLSPMTKGAPMSAEEEAVSKKPWWKLW